MTRNPRDSHANRDGADSKKTWRSDSRVVHSSPPQLFVCPRCSEMSFRIAFHQRDVTGTCAKCDLRLRTDRRIGRETREYYSEFNRQFGSGGLDRIQRLFLRMDSVSAAKRVYPIVRRLGYRTKQSSPMLHARLVMVETTRDQALVLIDKLRQRGIQVALQGDPHLPDPQPALPAYLVRKRDA
jgi:transcription elongation factor Elf1